MFVFSPTRIQKTGEIKIYFLIRLGWEFADLSKRNDIFHVLTSLCALGTVYTMKMNLTVYVRPLYIQGENFHAKLFWMGLMKCLGLAS